MQRTILLLPLMACAVPNQADPLTLANPDSDYCPESGDQWLIRPPAAGAKGY